MNDNSTKRSVLLVATLSAFLTPFMGSSINLALPQIGKEFNIDAVLLGWVATSYLLGAAAFLLPIGRIADIFGRKKIFTLGVSLFTFTTFLSAIAPSIKLLILFRALQGISGSMIFGTTAAILTSVFPPNERGKALGANVTAVYTGLATGPFVGGMLVHHFGWRSVFISVIPIGLIVLIVSIFKLKGEWFGARGEKIDFFGSAIYSISLVSMMYGFSLLPKTNGATLTSLGIIGLFIFCLWEMKAKTPVLDIKRFITNRAFAFSNLAALINYSATSAVGFLLSLYLQYIKGYSPQDAGSILIAQPIVMAIFSTPAGRLSDKVEPRFVASSGMALTVIGLFALIFLSSATKLGVLIAILILMGFGFALFSSPNTNAVMSSVDKRDYGIASGFLATMRLVGQMLSMGIVMLVFAVVIGRVQITQEVYPLFIKSMKIALGVFVALCALGTFASMVRGNVR